MKNLGGRLLRLVSATILASAALAAINLGSAFAATLTWNGTDCTGGTPNCNWSDGNNWVGGVAPAGGEDVVIDTSAPASGVTANTMFDDLPALSINSLTFSNNTTDGNPNYTLDINDPGTPGALTVVAGIIQDGTDTGTIPQIEVSEASGLVVGGSSDFTTSCDLEIGAQAGAVSPSIDLGSTTLTLNDTSGSSCSSANQITAISVPLSGAGNVVYNGPHTDFQMDGSSTYTGTTNVIATALPIGLDVGDTGVNMFGPSGTVTISSAGSVDFSSSSNVTVNNPVIDTGVGSGSPVTSIDFDCNDAAGVSAGGCNSAAAIALPNLTINGSTRFGLTDAKSNLKVNLNGFSDPGSFCVEYLGYASGNYTDGLANGFENGPTGCVVPSSGSGGSGGTGGSSSSGSGSSTPAPKSPDTGLAATKANPWTILAVTLGTSVFLFGVAFRFQPARVKSIFRNK